MQQTKGPIIKRRKAPLQPTIQMAPAMAQMGMAQMVAQAAAVEAETRHHVQHEQERAATAQVKAQLDVAQQRVAELQSSNETLEARVAAAERRASEAEKDKAAEAERAELAETSLRSRRAEAEAKQNMKAVIDELKAVHESTIFTRVEQQVAERRAEGTKALKEAAKAAAKAAKEHAKALRAAQERTHEVGMMAAAAIEEVRQQAAEQVESLTHSIGQYKRQLEPLKAAEAKRAAAAVETSTARIKAAEVAKELEAGRLNNEELRSEREFSRARIAQLEAELRQAKAGSVKLIKPHTSDSPDAPLTARTLEHLRRIVEETNCSFNGASTAIALVLELFIEGGPTEAQLMSNAAIKAAFERLGMIDEDRERASSIKYPSTTGPWAPTAVTRGGPWR